MRLIMSHTRRQAKMLGRAAEAKERREHRAYHAEQAEKLSAMADSIQAVLDGHPEMPEDARLDGERQIINYRAAALDASNLFGCEDDLEGKR